MLNDKGIPFLSFLRETEIEGIAYKDVHKRIKRLDKLGLIEKVPNDKIRTERESIHAPIFYRLTLGGLFNLLYKNREVMFTDDKNKIFLHHGDNIIFNTFVYPYFEQSTLTGIKGSFLPELIFDCVSKCCNVTDEICKGLTKDEGDRAILISLFKWGEVPGEQDMEIIRIIGNEFEVDFSEDSNIEKYNNNRSIRISDNNHCIIIQVNHKKNTATLTVNEGRTYELAVEKLGNELSLSKIGKFSRDIALPVMHYRVWHSLLNLAFSILMARKMGGPADDSM